MGQLLQSPVEIMHQHQPGMQVRPAAVLWVKLQGPSQARFGFGQNLLGHQDHPELPPRPVGTGRLADAAARLLDGLLHKRVRIDEPNFGRPGRAPPVPAVPAADC